MMANSLELEESAEEIKNYINGLFGNGGGNLIGNVSEDNNLSKSLHCTSTSSSNTTLIDEFQDGFKKGADTSSEHKQANVFSSSALSDSRPGSSLTFEEIQAELKYLIDVEKS